MSDDTALLREIRDILSELLALSKQRRKPAQSSDIADDAELDSQYGDEAVKFKPRDYTGDFTKGQRMSECAPELLDLLAASFDYFAQRNEGQMTDGGKPKSFYDKRSARRARGWAARKRAGWQAPKPVEGEEVRW